MCVHSYFGDGEMAFRVEEVVKDSFVSCVFGQEKLVFLQEFVRKRSEILNMALRGNPEDSCSLCE